MNIANKCIEVDVNPFDSSAGINHNINVIIKPII